MGADCAVHIVKFLSAHNVTHVTDPFCGKGTVLAAANAFGISAQGVDLSSKQGASLAHSAAFRLGRYYCTYVRVIVAVRIATQQRSR